MPGIGRLFGRSSARRVPSGTTPVPDGAHVIPLSVKREYDAVPVHVYHPTPHDAISVLRHRKNAHDWLVAGWYVDTYRVDGVVEGLMYRMVKSDEDRAFVLGELKRHDKDAAVRFSLE